MTKPTIFVNPKSGSIKISGEVDVVDVDGKVIESVENPKLCGCGLSKDKPWCDSSHGEYVKIVAQQLRNARELVKASNLFGATPVRAREIRENELKFRQEAGETLVGVKFGGNVFGYLTDAMQQVDSIRTAAFIHPVAEAEVVFKLSKEIDCEIHPSQVLDYVSHVAAGMEILDSRYGGVESSYDDAVADNAGAAAFAYGAWVPAHQENLDNLMAEVFVNDELVESSPLTSILGNPWLAIVDLSKVVTAIGVKLPADSIVYSGSATNGVHMVAGNSYRVEIKGLGKVDIKAS